MCLTPNKANLFPTFPTVPLQKNEKNNVSGLSDIRPKMHFEGNNFFLHLAMGYTGIPSKNSKKKNIVYNDLKWLKMLLKLNF